MGTNIGWTDEVLNVAPGCSKCSPGCQNCYAIREAWRLAANPNPKIASKYCGLVCRDVETLELDWSGRVNLDYDALEKPLHWKKPRRIFVQSMGDSFHERVPFLFVESFMLVAERKAPQHTYQLLTKRPERMTEFFDWYRGRSVGRRSSAPPNIWLGVTVCNQAEADAKIPLLLQIPAAVRFVSIEPMLGPIYINPWSRWSVDGSFARLDWIIAGGESGPNARPMHPDWVRALRDQCQAANVPFFFKQWGSWLPIIPLDEDYPGRAFCWIDHEGKTWESGCSPNELVVKVGPKLAGNLLDGQLWQQFPEATPCP